MSQHILTLQPTDVLFFKDGRPMEGSSAGHGAAWPLPHVLDSALHHALRRARFRDFTPHSHTVKRSGRELNADREQHGRQFGSLQSAGPFPIRTDGSGDQWFFPRPADAAQAHSSTVTHRPLADELIDTASSLHPKLKPVVNTLPPSKDKAETWLGVEAWQAYLDGTGIDLSDDLKDQPEEKQTARKEERKKHFLRDDSLFAAEHTVGIGTDPETGTQDGERIYSAAYLRLRPDFRIGLIASCLDKGKDGRLADTDLLEKTFLNSGHENHILAGGQQRTCTVLRQKAQTLPLPLGKTDGFTRHNGKWLVKWVLLTPAIYPHLKANPSQAIPEHPGGWLPSWIHPETLQVLLKDPAAPRPAREKGEARADYRRRLHRQLETTIDAHLVAVITGKPILVTGWALTDTHNEDGTLLNTGGARATHLAVPAGSVYYFECASPEAARSLATALNWHGTVTQASPPESIASVPLANNGQTGGSGHTIQNRRSTLMGEKGFGLGVCGTWNFHPA